MKASRIYCDSCVHWEASCFTVNESDSVIQLGYCHKYPVKTEARADHFCGEIQMTTDAVRKRRDSSD